MRPEINREFLDGAFTIIQGTVTAGGPKTQLKETIPKGKGICVIALDTVNLEGRTTEEIREEVLNSFWNRIKK